MVQVRHHGVLVTVAAGAGGECTSSPWEPSGLGRDEVFGRFPPNWCNNRLFHTELTIPLRFVPAVLGFVLAIVPTLDLRDTGTTTVTARGHFQSGRAPTGILPPLQRPRAPRVGRQLGCPGRRRFVGAERAASARPGGAGSTRASERPGPTLPSAFHQRNTGVLWDKGGCGAATDALAVRGGSLALLSGAACSRVLAK